MRDRALADDEGRAKARMPSPATGVALAASPVFAALALACGLQGDGSTSPCGAAHPLSPNGMVTLDLPMSALHVVPWLKVLVLPRAGRF